jgi:site-specific recombinase XerD
VPGGYPDTRGKRNTMGHAELMAEEADPLEAFEASLGGRDPKTVRAYMTTLRDLVDWISARPGGYTFHMECLTETAVKGFMDHLVSLGRAPRTRARALSAIRRFSRWAVDEGILRRNPTRSVERPTVVQLAPTELSEDQRYVLKSLVERTHSRRMVAIFALGYWAGLRIGEVACLRVADCELNHRAGALTVRDGKGGKTRALILHNEARSSLYTFIYEGLHDPDARDRESAFVFTSQRAIWLRKQGKPDHLSERGIEYLWQSLKATASREEWEHVKGVTFHDLRHDWAHRARGAGWLLEEIAVYAGHQTKDGAPAISTTVRYTLPSRQQLKARLGALRG